MKTPAGQAIVLKCQFHLCIAESSSKSYMMRHSNKSSTVLRVGHLSPSTFFSAMVLYSNQQVIFPPLEVADVSLIYPRFIYVLEYPNGNSVTRKRLRKRIMKESPFKLQDDMKTGNRMITGVDVLSIDEWNHNPVYSRFPLIKLTRSFTGPSRIGSAANTS